MSIDIHAHVVAEDLLVALRHELTAYAPALTRGDDGWTFAYPSGRTMGPVPTGAFDLGRRLADMDRQGVRTQALSVPPAHLMYGLPEASAGRWARLHNDSMVAAARTHPERFVVLGTLPMQQPDAALAEIDRLAALGEVAGVMLGTNVGGRSLADAAFADVWAALARHGLAVVLHPDNVAGSDRMREHYLRNLVGNPTETTLAAGALIFGGVLLANPALRVALVHGGGFLPYQIGRFDHGWRVRPEMRDTPEAPSELFGRLYFDTLTHDGPALRLLVERAGAARVCLGTDYPFDMGDADPARGIRLAGLDDETVDAVTGRTPRAFLTRTTPAG